MTCETNGVHEFPAGEESWGDPDCDRLFAVSMAGCDECAGPLERRLSERVSPAFGKVFTTLVIQTLGIWAQTGARVPETADQLFTHVQPPLAFPTQRALAGVKLPTVTAEGGPLGVTLMSLDFDTAVAGNRLREMSRNERVEVLRDAMDQIVGLAIARTMGVG